MPPQIRFIIGNEGCERFSFYGMRAILTVFMSSAVAVQGSAAVPGLGFAEADAKALFHTFVMSLYAFTVVGGLIADKWLGRYRTILYLSLVYCLGHAALSIWEDRFGLYLGLTLIAVGSGGIKPCVGAFVGDQFGPENQHLVKKVYGLFYWIINFGSFFASLLSPWLRDTYGNSVAFGVPGILMAVATLVLWMGQSQYRQAPLESRPSALVVLFHALTHQAERKAGQGFMDVSRAKYGDEMVEGVKAALGLVKVFLPISMFWSLFDQKASYWVLQAKKLNLDVDMFGTVVHINPPQLQALNPLLVMALIPLFTLVVYPGLEKAGWTPTPLRRIKVGLFVAGLPFIGVGLIQMALDGGGQPSVAWQFIPYVLLTTAEVLVSVTGLEFAYTQAPKFMKSTIMALWSVNVALGNGVTAIVSKLNMFDTATSFFFFAALMAVAAVVFTVVSKGFTTVEEGRPAAR